MDNVYSIFNNTSQPDKLILKSFDAISRIPGVKNLQNRSYIIINF